MPDRVSTERDCAATLAKPANVTPTDGRDDTSSLAGSILNEAARRPHQVSMVAQETCNPSIGKKYPCPDFTRPSSGAMGFMGMRL